MCVPIVPPVEEADTLDASGDTAAVNMMMPVMPSPPPDYDTLTMKKKRERKSSIYQPSYFGLVCDRQIDKHTHTH